MIPSASINKKDKNCAKQVIMDLNCDLGQSYGVYKNDRELELADYVSSVNIACGIHAGDPSTIKEMLKYTAEKNLSVGAHIGYPDIQGFGYRSMNLDEEEIKALVTYQIGALNALAKIYNLSVEHVRPHGALYVRAAEDYETSLAIAKAIAKYDPWLVYVGAPGENLINAGKEAGIRTIQELLLDKKYTVEGNIDFKAGDEIDYEYSKKLLETLVKESALLNNQGGKTKTDIKTVHLAMKSEFSVELAKKAKELIKDPVPVAGTYVAGNGWV